MHVGILWLMMNRSSFSSSSSHVISSLLFLNSLAVLDVIVLGCAGSGVSTDIWTTYAGIIMAISVIPFIIVQFPQMLHSDSGRHLAVLIGLIVSVSLLISYCLYQVFPQICLLISICLY